MTNVQVSTLSRKTVSDETSSAESAAHDLADVLQNKSGHTITPSINAETLRDPNDGPWLAQVMHEDDTVPGSFLVVFKPGHGMDKHFAYMKRRLYQRPYRASGNEWGHPISQVLDEGLLLAIRRDPGSDRLHPSVPAYDDFDDEDDDVAMQCAGDTAAPVELLITAAQALLFSALYSITHELSLCFHKLLDYELHPVNITRDAWPRYGHLLSVTACSDSLVIRSAVHDNRIVWLASTPVVTIEFSHLPRQCRRASFEIHSENKGIRDVLRPVIRSFRR